MSSSTALQLPVSELTWDIWDNAEQDRGENTDLGVPGAPAAPDQRAEVLEAKDRPPVEGEVTHTDQSHAHQVHQVKLK